MDAFLEEIYKKISKFYEVTIMIKKRRALMTDTQYVILLQYYTKIHYTLTLHEEQ